MWFSNVKETGDFSLNWNTLIFIFKPGTLDQLLLFSKAEAQGSLCHCYIVYIADCFLSPLFINCSDSHICMLPNLTGTRCHGNPEQNEIHYFRRWGFPGDRGASEGEPCGFLLCRASKARGSVCINKLHGDQGICQGLLLLVTWWTFTNLLDCRDSALVPLVTWQTVHWFTSTQIHIEGISSVSY